MTSASAGCGLAGSKWAACLPACLVARPNQSLPNRCSHLRAMVSSRLVAVFSKRASKQAIGKLYRQGQLSMTSSIDLLARSHGGEKWLSIGKGRHWIQYPSGLARRQSGAAPTRPIWTISHSARAASYRYRWPHMDSPIGLMGLNGQPDVCGRRQRASQPLRARVVGVEYANFRKLLAARWIRPNQPNRYAD